MFKSLLNARRIASISKNLQTLFESLILANANEDTILALVQKVREEHGEKVAQSLIEEISLHPENEVEFFRVKNVISIAKGFLLVREAMKRRVSQLTVEKIKLSNTPITIHALPQEAWATPWRVSQISGGLLLNDNDLQKAKAIQRKINELNSYAEEIRKSYYL